MRGPPEPRIWTATGLPAQVCARAPGDRASRARTQRVMCRVMMKNHYRSRSRFVEAGSQSSSDGNSCSPRATRLEMRFARQSLHPDVAAFGEPVDLPSRFEVDAEFRVDNVADHTEFNFGLGTQSESVADFLRDRDLSAISNFHTI